MLHVALTAASLQARKLKLLEEKHLQQQGAAVDALGKVIKEADALRIELRTECESLESEINRQKIVQQRRTEWQVSAAAHCRPLRTATSDALRMPPPQEERWQQQLSRVNEQLQERDSELRKTCIDYTDAASELTRVKQQLSETSTQLIQAQQQAQLPPAQIEQQVAVMHARCYSVVMHH